MCIAKEQWNNILRDTAVAVSSGDKKVMKQHNHLSTCVILFGLLLVTVNLALTETAVKEERTTTMSAGTVSEYGTDVLTIKPELALDPVRYSTIKTTSYVDESGAPVSVDIIKPGLPVTVHYVKIDDEMVVAKVVVRKTGTTPVKNNTKAVSPEKTPPPDQGSSKVDVDTTSQIRKEIFAAKEMSANAQNVKIITNNGRVTLRGPVNTEEEKRLITEIAMRIAIAANVDNQLEVQLTTGSKK